MTRTNSSQEKRKSAVSQSRHLKDVKRILLLVIDAILINVAFILAYVFRFEAAAIGKIQSEYLSQALVITITYLLFFFLFHFYHTVWIYAGADEILRGALAYVCAAGLSIFYQVIDGHISIPIILLATLLCGVFTTGIRLSYRLYIRARTSMAKSNKNQSRMMIIGAGQAASIAIKEMRNNQKAKYHPVCIIDDDPAKIGTILSGIHVLGDRKSIERIVGEQKIDVILIAIPSLSGESRKEILQICKRTHCQVQTMPSLIEILSGETSVDVIRNVQADDYWAEHPLFWTKKRSASARVAKPFS